MAKCGGIYSTSSLVDLFCCSINGRRQFLFKTSKIAFGNVLTRSVSRSVNNPFGVMFSERVKLLFKIFDRVSTKGIDRNVIQE